MNIMPLLAKETALTSIIATLIALFMKDRGGVIPYALLLFTPLVTILNNIYLRKERSVPSLVIFNSIFIVLTEIIVFVLRGTNTVFSSLLLIPVLMIFSGRSIKGISKDITIAQILRSFDYSLLTLLITFAYATTYFIDYSIIFTPLLGVILSFVAILYMRQGERKGGWIVTSILTLITVSLIVLLEHYADEIGNGILGIWNGIKKLAELFYAFLLWIFSLFPPFRANLNYDIIPKADDNEYRRDVISDTLDTNVLRVIFLFIFFLASLIVLIYMLRHVHLKRKKGIKTLEKSRIKHLSLLEALKRAIEKIKENQRERRFIKNNKNNALGFSLWAEKKLSRTEWRKRENETRAVFIKNLSSYLDSPLLESEADKVDSYLYSNRIEKVEEIENIDDLYNKINKVLLKRKIEEIKESMKRKKEKEEKIINAT